MTDFSAKKIGMEQSPFRRGAGGGSRTHTVSLPQDFESSASANSTTPAQVSMPPITATLTLYYKSKQKAILFLKIFKKFPNIQSFLIIFDIESSAPGKILHILSSADSLLMFKILTSPFETTKKPTGETLTPPPLPAVIPSFF